VSFEVDWCWEISGLSPSCRPLVSDIDWSILPVSDGLISPMCSFVNPVSGSAALTAASSPITSAFRLRSIPFLQSLSCCSLSIATWVLGREVVRSI